MILRDEGPNTSMDEDVKALGLGYLFESDGNKKSKPTPGGATEGDAVSERNEVPVRTEAAGEDDYGATKATAPATDAQGDEKKDDDKDGDKNGDDHAEPDADDKGGAPDGDADDKGAEQGAAPAPAEKPNPFAKKEDQDEIEQAVESVLSLTPEDVDHLDEEALDGAYTVMCALEDAFEDGSPKLEASYNVIDAFYSQLAEGETNTIDRDTLIGVVESMEYVLRDMGIVTEGCGMGKAISRHASRSLAKGKMISPVMLDKHHKAQEMKVKLSKASGFKKGLAAFKPPVLKSKHEQSDDIAGLVNNLTALRDIAQNGAAEQAGSEVMEGLEAIHATASTWMEAIANEVKTALAEGQTDENDPRIVIGRHLESIAEDAIRVGQACESGEFPMESIENDLRNLAADLDDTVEVMKQVE